METRILMTRSLITAALLLLPIVSRSQSPSDASIYATATTTTDSQGQHWGYLLWSSASPSLVKERAFAIYSKSGDANSPAPYVRRAVTGLQTDPLVIAPILSRATTLGHRPETLETAIDGMFDMLMTPQTIGLPEKLSAVLRGALRDPEHCENLFLLARLHSAAAMAIGVAHAERIPGPIGAQTTFEIRSFDTVQASDLSVVGRVTVTAGMPLLLPAPGAPLETVDTSPQGDLNVKLLWPTPTELRRLSLAHHGFNVFRVEAALAESLGMHLAPPTTATLLNLVRNSTNAHQVNRSPIISTEPLTPAEAVAQSSDPTRYFFTDTNERGIPKSSLPQSIFRNGAQFLYFVTARDILGRDGLVSPGTRIRICDRMPPLPPLKTRVETAYAHDELTHTVQQRLVAVWDQNVDSPPEHTTHYYVYRWSSIAQFQSLGGNPAAQRIAGPLPHIPGRRTQSYVDDGPGAPEASTHAGQTFWYTIRASDEGACAPGPNLSGHSAPAFGVLRDFAGPKGGGGRISVRCIRPVVTVLPSTVQIPNTSPGQPVARYYLECAWPRRTGVWAEFFARPRLSPNPPTPLGRRYFAAGETEVVAEVPWPPGTDGVLTPPEFFCRVGLANGTVSELVGTAALVGLPIPISSTIRVTFNADVTTQRSPLARGCEFHDPVPPGNEGSGTIDPLVITLFPPETTREWRLYRRVDTGPLSLLAQGDVAFDNNAAIEALDDGPPANAARLCYFVQFLDEHGNAGPMIEIGCVHSEGTTPVATPILSKIKSSGTPADPRMLLEWFCPTYGVERFEVWIGGTPLAPGSDMAPQLKTEGEVPAGLIFGDGPQPPQLYRRYLTPRIGPALGSGPVFSIPARVALGNTMTVFVKALTANGAESAASNVERFLWGNTNIAGPDVRWPARPLPLANNENYPGVIARSIQPADTPGRPWEGLAVRIGEIDTQITAPDPALPDQILGHVDPAQSVYQSPAGESLLDVALYRFQIPNLRFPQVSGDVAQVSPLMESIAYETGSLVGQNTTFVHDPFIRLLPQNSGPPTRRGVWILDTTPVLEGARYQYVLVRFRKSTHEPVETITTLPITVP